MLTDLRYLSQFTAGDATKLNSYIQLYIATITPLIKKLEYGRQHRDEKIIREAAHSIFPMMKFVGLTEVAKDLKLIEKACRKNTGCMRVELTIARVEGLCRESVKELENILHQEEKKKAPHKP